MIHGLVNITSIYINNTAIVSLYLTVVDVHAA